MQYREFSEDLDFEVSALGFGAMRLPTTDEEAFSPNIFERIPGFKMVFNPNSSQKFV